jgi:very-short-patch-repair endonuclease
MATRPAKPRTARARDLRATSTDAEHKLWAALRARQLGGFKFRRQVPIDRYFADFACVEAKLVVELDGGQHMARFDYDERRTSVLEACGWRVMRFWNNDVLENIEGVGLEVLAALEVARP